MYLLAHNAHLVSVDTAPIAADPTIGITGGSINRWRGDAQAYLDQTDLEVIRGNQRVIETTVIADLPSNLPVVPNENDILTFQLPSGSQQKLKVRNITTHNVLSQAKLRVTLRVS